MPTKLKTRCRQAGCPELTDNKTGYCDRHKSQSAYRTQRTDIEAQRLYRTNRWKEVSKAKRAADPFCERCAMQGKIVPATLVHHIVPVEDGGDFWNPRNHESVCGTHQAEAHRGKK